MARPYLGDPKNTIEVLKKYEFVFQKRFGQNFLIDTHVLDKIIQASQIQKEDFVLEIGPGIGTMTQYLACAAGKVAAVEIDKALIPILEDTLDGYDNVQVINEDVLKVDIAELAKRENEGKPCPGERSETERVIPPSPSHRSGTPLSYRSGSPPRRGPSRRPGAAGPGRAP